MHWRVSYRSRREISVVVQMKASIDGDSFAKMTSTDAAHQNLESIAIRSHQNLESIACISLFANNVQQHRHD
jgi:hypothetical protein